MRRWLLFVGLVCLLAACREGTAPATTTVVAPAGPTRQQLAPLPTLYPTDTPPASPAATATRPTPTPAPTGTAIDFEQEVVFLRYEIPLLGVDRSLSGNVSSALLLRDETTGVEAARQNQPGILLELQSVLDGLELAELPADCPGCVRFSYRLPVAGEAGSGWLEDPVLLASVENYFAANLQPHFPPGTVLGLRRSASNTDVAHTLALTADGTLWRWTAVDAEVAAGEPAGELADRLTGLVAELEPVEGAAYVLNCPGRPFEQLFLEQGESAGQRIPIRCPEMVLPATWLPLYGALGDALLPILSGDVLPADVRQPLRLRDAVFLGTRGGALHLAADGSALAGSGAISVTGTLTTTTIVSLTAALLDTGRLRLVDNELVLRVLVTDTSTLPSNLLLVRTDQGVFSYDWSGTPPQDLSASLALLQRLLDALLATVRDEATPPAAVPTPDSTAPAVTGTPIATPNPVTSPSAEP